MNKKIKFNYKGNDYVLEFNRKSISQMEKMGFDITKFESMPMTMLPLTFRGAFFKNHNYVKEDFIDECFDLFEDKQKLITTLADMISETYDCLLTTNKDGNEGNIEWEIV